MIRIVIKGGLGNQMFQYAYAKLLSIEHNLPLILDLSSFEKDDSLRKFALNKLGIEENITKKRPHKHIRSLWKKLLRLNLFLIKRNFPPLSCIYLDGYWQSESYFCGKEDIVRSLFKLPSRPSKTRNKILKSDSVAVHVRRGDYLKIPLYHVCDLNYYINGMRTISSYLEKPRFFIFSDDIDWCKSIVDKFPETILVQDSKSDLEDLELMSICKHIIISNSSFSWWGAWLNEHPKKIVITPDRWVTDTKLNYKFMSMNKIIPKRWVQIPTSKSTD